MAANTPRAALVLLCLAAWVLSFAEDQAFPASTDADHATPVIALTFDDGPYAGVTARILDVLEEHSAVATFFVPGCRVEGRGEILRRMEALGCEIGCHGFSHRDLTVLDRETLEQELEAADAAFEAELGHAPSVMRPPYGHYNETVRVLYGKPLILWNVDTDDWQKKEPEALAAYVIERAAEGSVILMHDQQPSTAEAIERMIPALVKAGFRFVTAGRLIEETGGKHKAILMPP